MGMISKNVGLSIVSLLLVVGIVIGAVVIFQVPGSSDTSPSTSQASSGSTSTSSKTVQAICAPTQHKEACASSLKGVKEDASIKDYLEAAVKATLNEVRKALNSTSNVVIDKDNDPHNDKKGLQECKYFLKRAVDELDTSITQVIRSDINTIQKNTKEFISWLTGANIYLQTCVDEMGKAEHKAAIQHGTKNAAQLTDNALYIFAKIKEVLDQLNITDTLTKLLSENTTSGSLLDDVAAAPGAENASIPHWISKTGRKLLQGPPPTPNAVVALDGSGQYKTIMEAVNAVPVANTQTFVIQVKAGIYNEIVEIKDKHNVLLLGDGIGKTIITGSQSSSKGGTTSTTATLAVDSNLFMARGLTIENTAGPDDHQAVALRINGQKTVVFECEIKGYQDTLYYHRGLQFYKNCIISGTVDFIFGYGRAIVQDSLIVARLPGANQENMITADGGLNPVGQHGLVVQNCKIVAEPQLMAAKATTRTFLGRPWKEWTVTMFLQNEIDDFIVPAGYSIFVASGPGSTNQVNAIYGEYMNTGPGAANGARDITTFPKYKNLTAPEAEGYTVAKFIDGPAWIPGLGAPFKAGL